jgi:hypothetical protein
MSRFVLNKPEYLPAIDTDLAEALDRNGDRLRRNTQSRRARHRLVAFHVGANVGGRQQLDRYAHLIQTARPMVGRTAGFHDDQADIPILKPALELGTQKAMQFDDLPGCVGDGQ